MVRDELVEPDDAADVFGDEAQHAGAQPICIRHVARRLGRKEVRGAVATTAWKIGHICSKSAGTAGRMVTGDRMPQAVPSLLP